MNSSQTAGGFCALPQQIALLNELPRSFKSGLGLSYDQFGSEVNIGVERLLAPWFRTQLVSANEQNGNYILTVFMGFWSETRANRAIASSMLITSPKNIMNVLRAPACSSSVNVAVPSDSMMTL